MNIHADGLNARIPNVRVCFVRLYCVCCQPKGSEMPSVSDNTKGKCIFAASSFSVLGLFFHFYLELCSEQTNVECVKLLCIFLANKILLIL